MMKKTLTLFIICALCFSCSTKKVPYLASVETLTSEELGRKIGYMATRIAPGDILTIDVTSDDPEAVQPFNKTIVSRNTQTQTTQERTTYLVDNNGFIDFPVIGRINIGGLTKSQAEEFLISKIYPRYLTTPPTISIRQDNFNVTVLGDVKSPGVKAISNERVSVLEALAMAGDINIGGMKDNILLVRFNSDGTREVARLDVNNKDFLFSPYFYLQQNDVLYVEPSKAKVFNTLFAQNAGVYLSIASLITSLIMTITYLTRL